MGMMGRVLSFVIAFFCSSLSHSATSFNGALEGVFDVSPTGAATYTIPIEVPPGINGLQPNLALTYNSQSGNGMLGMGWALSGLSEITRCPQTLEQDGKVGGINFDASDRFCLDGQRLIAVSGVYGGNGTEYRTETESFSKIISYGGQASSGPDYFRVWTKDGMILAYGDEYGNNTNYLRNVKYVVVN